jgi:hypothetical protein
VLSIVQVFHHIGNVKIGSVPSVTIQQGEYFLDCRVLSRCAVTSNRPNEFRDSEDSLVREFELLRKVGREQSHVGEIVFL